MLRLAEKENELREAYESGQLRPRIKRGWEKLDAHDRVPNFPRLTEDDIRGMTFGVYQLHQAELYADEHLKGGKYKVSNILPEMSHFMEQPIFQLITLALLRQL